MRDVGTHTLAVCACVVAVVHSTHLVIDMWFLLLSQSLHAHIHSSLEDVGDNLPPIRTPLRQHAHSHTHSLILLTHTRIRRRLIEP